MSDFMSEIPQSKQPLSLPVCTQYKVCLRASICMVQEVSYDVKPVKLKQKKRKPNISKDMLTIASQEQTKRIGMNEKHRANKDSCLVSIRILQSYEYHHKYTKQEVLRNSIPCQETTLGELEYHFILIV